MSKMQRIGYNDHDEIRDLLMWRTVTVDWANEQLVLDNGVRLKIKPNIGGCSCGAGDYVLEKLDGTTSAITNVQVAEQVDDVKRYEPDRTYAVHVLTEDKQMKTLWEVQGNDGNGYYGTGYWIEVHVPREKQ